MPLLDFELSQVASGTLTEDQLNNLKNTCSEGYTCYDAKNYKAALRLFYQAWLILPKPQSAYKAAGWVLTAIGDTYFRLGQHSQAIEALSSAIHCEGMAKNPFVFLRLGQSYLDSGEISLARRELFKAWNKGGAIVFESEPPQYYSAIEDLLGV